MKNNDNEKSKSKKNQSGSNTSSKKEVHLGDDIKKELVIRIDKLATSIIDQFFDSIEEKIPQIPESIKKFRYNQSVKKEIASSLSKQLYEKNNDSESSSAQNNDFELIISAESLLEVITQNINSKLIYKRLECENVLQRALDEIYLDGVKLGILRSLYTMLEAGISLEIVHKISDSLLLQKKLIDKPKASNYHKRNISAYEEKLKPILNKQIDKTIVDEAANNNEDNSRMSAESSENQ